MIIGRDQQKAILSRISQSKQAEFVIVYGRRRVGKTFLIESFFENHKRFFHIVGIQKGSLKEHLKEFSKEVGRVFYGGAKKEALNYLRADSTDHRNIVFFIHDLLRCQNHLLVH